MPEVVEVCLTAQFLNHLLKNSKIINLEIIGGRYTRHKLHGLDSLKNNIPLKIINVNSKGKFLWFELENNFFILNTFGLEGEWGFQKKSYSAIKLTFQNKNNTTSILYFSDPRNFGTLLVTQNRTTLENKINSLGPDLLKNSFNNDEFYNRFNNYLSTKKGISKARSNRKIIKVLMDQNFNTGIGSGLGNYLAVEILFDAKISPHTTMLTLFNNKTICNNLANSIQFITKLAYLTSNIGYINKMDPQMKIWIDNTRKNIFQNKNHPFNFHPHVIIDPQNKFKFNVYRKKINHQNNKIIADKIIPGRTTYWDPNIQK